MDTYWNHSITLPLPLPLLLYGRVSVSKLYTSVPDSEYCFLLFLLLNLQRIRVGELFCLI
jgi:hypothetical protein